MDRKPVGYFTATNSLQNAVMWTAVLLNILLIAAGSAWLLLLGATAPPPLWAVPLLLAVSLFVSDLASGVVHWGTDTWFSERSLGRGILVAREHHSHPQNILGYSFLDHASLGSLPSVLVVGPLMIVIMVAGPSPATVGAIAVMTAMASLLLFGTWFHNLGHHWSANRLVRVLQKAGVLMTPAYHGVHHRPPQMIRYCVITGWANPVCDRLRLWRGLERLITALTGYQPRVDDIAWRTGWKARVSGQGAAAG